MTRHIEEFYKNPTGIASKYSNIASKQTEFSARYEKISGNLDLDACIIEGKRIYIRLKMPSSIQGIFYDVVIRFDVSGTDDMRKMSIKLFSNSPSFTYTYGYAYSHSSILIDELKGKLNPVMLKKPAEKTNANSITGYDFSIYCLLRAIIEKDLLNIDAVKGIQITDRFNKYYRSILHADHVSKERGAQKDKLQREKERAKMREEWKAKTTHILDSIKSVFTGKNTKEVPTVKNSKTVKTVKKV